MSAGSLALPDFEIDDTGDGRGVAFLTNFGPNITFMKFFGGRDVDLTRIGARMSYRF